jgi:uncharacterized phiE125 gp8 family phage protein
MPLKLIEAPEAEPVTLAEAKAFVRVEQDAEDALFGTLIAAAREHVEQATGRQLVAATWELTLRCFPPDYLVRLPRSPLIEVVSVKYRDRAGALITLTDEVDYLTDAAAEPGTVEPVKSWPATGDFPDAVQVRFTAGYPSDGASPPDHAANVPARAKVAVKALLAHWYENREAAGVAEVYETAYHVARLINGLRVWGA